MSALSLASAHYRKLLIIRLNDLLVKDLCKKILLLPYSLFFWFSNMILSDALIFTRIAASNIASDNVTN